MPVPRRRHCKSRRDKSRTHQKITARQLIACPKCGAMRQPHRVCPACGAYRGREYKTTVTS